MSDDRTSLSRFQKLVLIFLLSRLGLEIVGILAGFYFPSAQQLGRFRDLQYHQTQPRWLDMWARWDSEWWLLVADKGYSSSVEVYRNFGGGRYLPTETAKLFPVYPLAIRCLTFLVRNSVLAGFLIANLAAITFLYYLHRLANKLLDEDSAAQTVLLYVVYPTSFYLSAVYSESLFLAALTAAFFYIEEKKLLPAAMACGIAILTRSTAFIAAPALVWLAWQKFENRKALSAFTIASALVIPLLMFLIFVKMRFGSVFAVTQSIEYWRGDLKYPFYAFVRFFQGDIAIHGQHNSIIDFVFAAIHIVILVISYRKIPAPYYLYSIVAIVFPLCSTLFSFSRLSLANIPFFLYAGRATVKQPLAALLPLAILLAFFMAAFANWFWVG